MNKTQKKIGKVMGEYKEGKSKDQALAIALSEASKMARYKK